MRDINVGEFSNMFKEDRDGLEVVDVREQYEYDEVHIEGSKLIPMMGVQNRINEIDWSKTVVFVCRSGARSGHVARSLDNKYVILNLAGGIIACSGDSECQIFLVRK